MWQPQFEAVGTYNADRFLACAHACARTLDPVVALLGTAHATAGRYSVVGVPSSVAFPSSAEQALAAFDTVPNAALRIVALSYEFGAAQVFEPLASPPSGQPHAVVADLRDALVFDHATCELFGLGAYRRLLGLFPGDLIPTGAEAAPAPHARAPRPPRLTLNPFVPDSIHAARILQCQEHIARGDIYQANLTRQLHVADLHDPAAFCVALHRWNPVPHGAYMKLGSLELVSNSMETLLTYDPTTRALASYPIKGTRRPGADTELLSNDKERAEHIMIVDLVRNDLGRVCVPGSVNVGELMGAYTYRGVVHGISTIGGQLAPRRTLADAVAALFPGGSITGAPKRRATQIIGALECAPRGFYTGSLALLAPSGRLSMSILIRTLVRDGRGWCLGVGGGIVADSDPDREIEETWDKVSVFGARASRKPQSARTSQAPNDPCPV